MILICFLFCGCHLPKNFHEIDPGNFYRSAQLTGEEFEKAISRYGIKTIINLRGEAPGEVWFETEKLTAKLYDAELINIKMSAKRLPHKEDLIKLLDAYKNAPRPILVHCRAGVDRTGEATAIYVQEYMGWNREESLEMLSFKYLHIPEFMPAKTYFIRNIYQDEQWAREEYNPCQNNYRYYDKNLCSHSVRSKKIIFSLDEDS